MNCFQIHNKMICNTISYRTNALFSLRVCQRLSRDNTGEKVEKKPAQHSKPPTVEKPRVAHWANQQDTQREYPPPYQPTPNTNSESYCALHKYNYESSVSLLAKLVLCIKRSKIGEIQTNPAGYTKAEAEPSTTHPHPTLDFHSPTIQTQHLKESLVHRSQEEKVEGQIIYTGNLHRGRKQL